MTEDHGNLQAIPDQKPVRIFLPIIDTVERYRASCVLEKTASPAFKLLFKPGALPVDSIDRAEACYITVDVGGVTTSIEAMIDDIPNDQTLNMVVEKSFSHDQLREFFRVDAQTSVISSSFLPEFYNEKGEPWSLQGKTIDISGSGLLASFNAKPPVDKQVKLQLTLPTPEQETVTLLAHPVRAHQISDDNYEVAYHFDDISTEDRDKIIGWCLIIQRRLLRLKVQVKEPVSK
ncbi:PilZ domain-containing protein [Desulfopila sp. IMCC35008]|uniref:PilZ domain-containing protein n=1 Tax=Desulfopila sp. IMCC35008 TaxID=2653858 RepID=UPI0013D55F88|nr:PilZ domain-containing protein [Desulfopila sp. IMCC35008]